MKKTPVLAIAGPTASGKTAAALALAERLPIEVISVDSAQVYLGMDIGTAKPTPRERAQVPHHLIDILDPTERYSAARFVDDAQRLIADIDSRGRVPVLVGGTMLYLKALADGLDTMPAADLAVRAELDRQAAELGWPALHAELARIDPPTAARLAPGDAQRIQRALEVHRVSGKPLSAWHRHSDDDSGGWPMALISLEPRQRTWLHERIAARLAAMEAAGFIDEVSRLRKRGDLSAAMPSMRAVGYRQAWAALEAATAEAIAAWPARALAATRQLAKRQMTWLRAMPARHVIACDEPDAVRRVTDAAMQVLRLSAANDAVA